MPSFVIDNVTTTQQTLGNLDFGLITENGILLNTNLFASDTFALQVDGSFNIGLGVLAISAFSGDPAVNSSIQIGRTGQITSLSTFDASTTFSMIDLAVSGSFTLNNAGQVSANTGAIKVSNATSTPACNAQIINSGEITSTFEHALILNVGSGQATVFNTGTISTLGASDVRIPAAIAIGGNGFNDITDRALITNTGLISSQTRVQGATPDAISLFGLSAFIENTGTIVGRIAAFGLEAGEIITIANSGTILGNIFVGNPLFGSTVGALRLTNTGTIQGDITGSSVNDILTIVGGTVSGSISGGDGEDQINLIGGAVGGVVFGGAGSDLYLVDSTSDRIRETSFGDLDTVASTISWSLGFGFENLELAGDAAVVGNGNAADNLLIGSQADNILRGRGGDDTIIGSEGDDTLIGGSGDDTYQIDNGDTIIEAAGAGTDTVQILDVFGAASYTLSSEVENLEFSPTSSVTVTGNALNNRMVTGSGNDTLNGLTGTDTLEGGSGNDTYITDGGDTFVDTAGIDTIQSSVGLTLGTGFEKLTLTGTAAINGTGNTLANTIVGNSGANSLNGGAGNDTLTGGAGSDSFVFNAALGTGNVDRITDFDAVADTIRLENAIFTGLAAGTLAATAFVSNISGNAADASDRIIYESDTGRLYFDSDGIGAGDKVHFATLATGLTLTSADFFVF